MRNRDERALEILRELGSRPAAPFFEGNVAQYILETLEKIGVESYRDANGNIMPSKSKSTERIDGVVATIIAMSRAIVQPETPVSVYENRGLIRAYDSDDLDNTDQE